MSSALVSAASFVKLALDISFSRGYVKQLPIFEKLVLKAHSPCNLLPTHSLLERLSNCGCGCLHSFVPVALCIVPQTGRVICTSKPCGRRAAPPSDQKASKREHDAKGDGNEAVKAAAAAILQTLEQRMCGQ